MLETIAKIEDLSTSQLVTLYNEHAAKPVKRFENRAAGVKRVTDLLTAKHNAEVISQEIETMEVTNEAVENLAIVEQARKALDASDPVELPSITDLEHRVLAGVAESDFQDGHDPEDCKLVWSFSVTDFLPKKTSAGGVIASLVKKGLLSHTPKSGDTDECIAFTALGAKVYREKVEPTPLPDVSKPAKAPKAPKAEKAPKEPKEPSKADIMFGMIQQEGGALKSELLKVCGWKGCAVALGRICEKNGMELEKTKIAGDWTYRAVAKADQVEPIAA
jgi:hypothetical protein